MIKYIYPLVEGGLVLAKISKVDGEESLQNLITHTIFIKRANFSMNDIVTAVCKSKSFNQFCGKEKVTEKVKDTLDTFLRDQIIDCYGKENVTYYYLLPKHT